jgi:hypothetical protein
VQTLAEGLCASRIVSSVVKPSMLMNSVFTLSLLASWRSSPHVDATIAAWSKCLFIASMTMLTPLASHTCNRMRSQWKVGISAASAWSCNDHWNTSAQRRHLLYNAHPYADVVIGAELLQR